MANKITADSLSRWVFWLTIIYVGLYVGWVAFVVLPGAPSPAPSRPEIGAHD
ncbi:MAG: hypothetical protein OZ921_09715 [Sorangiineae bacterium]|nr:hypothetical protein [Polyangiaceae bacterium]MEB2322781.1 hypothetical protein [Sorangiineae bacterium]